MAVRQPGRRSLVVIVAVAAVLGVTMLAMPVPTRRGVDRVVVVDAVPLYLKVLDFVTRDLQYRRLASRVTSGQRDDEARVLAAYHWTRANIREAPDSLPLVDDHPWHIVVRGYGSADQQADVFTMLTTYARIPGYWAFNRAVTEPWVASFVWIAGAWRVFDVGGGRVFRTAAGTLLTVEEAGAENLWAGRPVPARPAVLRAELQMVGPRLWLEAGRLAGRAPAMVMDPPVIDGAGLAATTR